MLKENTESKNNAKNQKFTRYAYLVLLSFGFMYLFRFWVCDIMISDCALYRTVKRGMQNEI